ncbi:hypothetical protein [Mesorhizobium sp. M7A.F.Ca.AU.002.02.1.1]|uniref:hypothetical protein n=1 Tax=Mesorhizobium sp. M7A.F.Ca.AU.002.02.1.1 TaxID=2496671 RepID=UPI001FDF0F4E|nr:hypothetical protein [Mesorhizobium sp. M7A.F.Ca.AU.002.02.1.1]
MLDRALVHAGHRSIVIACRGSSTSGTLVEIPAENGMLDEAAKRRAQEAHRKAIAAARARWPIDVVHLHGIDFDAYLPDDGPTLVTLHLPLDWYPAAALRPTRGDLWLHAVSPSQQKTAPSGARLTAPIPNGVDIQALNLPQPKRDFALVLSRVCPEKGIHLALDAAKLAGVPLVVGGKVYPYETHSGTFATRSNLASMAAAASLARSASPPSDAFSTQRAVWSFRASQPRPARLWPWRPSPAGPR